MKNNQKVIVDTSIWIEYFNRPDSKEGNKLEELILNNKIFITGIIKAELYQGAKTNKEFNLLKESLSIIPVISTTSNIWEITGELSFKLRRKGLTIPITDCLIAACAIKNNLKIFSLDKHFKSIPQINLL